MDGVINRYTWHKECVTCGSLQKVLAIKPNILNVIRHKTSLEVKGVQPHIYVLSIKDAARTGLIVAIRGQDNVGADYLSR